MNCFDVQVKPSNMKRIFYATMASALVFTACQSNAKPTPEPKETIPAAVTKLWETDTILRTPESVLYDAGGNRLIVSLINGNGSEKDGIGEIAILTPDGKVVNTQFTQGLNAPKGLALHQNKLYVSDIDQVVLINANTGEILKKIGIDTAKFLNDVTVDPRGTVYVSDSRTGTIYTISNDIASEYKHGFNNVNGLNFNDGTLWVLAHDELKKIHNDSVTTVAKFPVDAMDGIEIVDDSTFITSSWHGQIFLAKKDGTVTEILNTREEKKNTADIGYDAKTRTVFVPTFFGNTVSAYKVDE